MKIRTYLALMIFSSLFVVYSIQNVLSSYHHNIQTISEEKSQYALNMQDFSNLKKNLHQMLISLDFVLGSDQTYFSAGAIEQGKFILKRLNYLTTSTDLFPSKKECDIAIKDIESVLTLLIQATEIDDIYREE